MTDHLSLVYRGTGSSGDIYISGYEPASCLATLKEAGIEAVISITKSGRLNHSRAELPDYLYIPAEDHPSYDISQHFPTTNKFIELALKHTNVLVHCMAGVSRSATLVVAFLVEKKQMSVRRALDTVRTGRNKVCPNRGFLKHLVDLEQRVRNSSVSSLAKGHFRKRTSSSINLNNQLSGNSEESQSKGGLTRTTSIMVESNIKNSPNTRASSVNSKIAQKIEKVKSNLLRNIEYEKGRLSRPGHSKTVSLTFENLLNSKIYKNKLRMR